MLVVERAAERDDLAGLLAPAHLHQPPGALVGIEPIASDEHCADEQRPVAEPEGGQQQSS